MRKNKKGAALIITLFMLVIVSVFISLTFLISKNEIKLYSSSREESKYTQYLKEAVDITISPLVMGNGNWFINSDTYKNKGNSTDEFCDILNGFQSDPFRNLLNDNNINLRIRRESTSNPGREFIINISRRIEQGSNLWVLSQVRGRAFSSDRAVPEYELYVNTVIVTPNPQNALADGVPSFANFVNQQINGIKWQGRARAVIQQRTPYNIAGGSALFVKYAGLWVPFGANPFYDNLINEGIDRCVGLSAGYNLLGDVATPAVRDDNFGNAFNGRQNTRSGGITTVWDNPHNPNDDPGLLIKGGAYTGYAGITEDLSTFENMNSKEYSLRTTYNAKVESGMSTSNVEGKIPGEGSNNVIDLDSISTRRVTISINDNKAVVVGERVDAQGNLTGEIRTRSQGGGLVEIMWPLDQNGNLVPINPTDGNDPNRQILNTYPPGYANVYIVPEGNRIRIFAVGKYSGRKVPANELLSAIRNLPVNPQLDGNDLIIRLENLTPDQRAALSTIHVEGGNVVLMPSSDGNSTLFYTPQGQNQPEPFDLTVIATRFVNRDEFADENGNFYRSFYTNNNSNGQPIDPKIGGWVLPANNNQPFTPNGFTVGLGGNGVQYFIPSPDEGSYDRRQQVTRALEGNVIIQDFHDSSINNPNNSVVNRGIGVRDGNEPVGYIGANLGKLSNQQQGDPRSIVREGGHFTILSHNFTILNYQSRANNRPQRNGVPIEAYLFADVVSYRGSLQIIDEDSYRFLFDIGRFRKEQANGFLNNIVSDDNLYWYGRYMGNFANIEGVLLENGSIRGFGNVTIESSGINQSLPRATRKDYIVKIGNRPVILYSIVKFEVNK